MFLKASSSTYLVYIDVTRTKVFKRYSSKPQQQQQQQQQQTVAENNTMAKGEGSHTEMAHARQSDGISVIFDQNSPASSRSRSRSSRSSGSGHNRGRSSHRGRYRSSSSSSSSSRSSRSRSRSHPRCHRRSSRCRCHSHHKYGHGRYRCSPSRRYRAYSRSYSRSPSPVKYSRRRRYRSRSRSCNRRTGHRRAANQFRRRSSRSPVRTYRSRSRSRSSVRSVSFSVDVKRDLLKAAKANAMKILGVEKLELPESVKPVLSEQLVESKRVSPEPEPETRVRQDPAEILSQSNEAELDDSSSPKMSPKRRIISFSINNSVAKPTVSAPSCAKVTPRVDSYESRKPYGHWVPVKSGQSSSARKHKLTMSH